MSAGSGSCEGFGTSKPGAAIKPTSPDINRPANSAPDITMRITSPIAKPSNTSCNDAPARLTSAEVGGTTPGGATEANSPPNINDKATRNMGGNVVPPIVGRAITTPMALSEPIMTTSMSAQGMAFAG
jgi:hypothetical protein